MPCYLYKNPETDEIIELLQSVNDEHSYTFAGVKWNRVWTVPQIVSSMKIDPFSEQQFLDKTNKQCQTIGDLWDRAAEMKEMREEKTGAPDEISANFNKGKKVPKKKNKEIKIEIG